MGGLTDGRNTAGLSADDVVWLVMGFTVVGSFVLVHQELGNLKEESSPYHTIPYHKKVN